MFKHQIFYYVSLKLLVIILSTFILSSASIIRVRESERRIECPRGCAGECDKCEYGVSVSQQCGVLECRKGPDERCGGHGNGACGDGMICLCERCIGCSTDTLECSSTHFDHPCLPPGINDNTNDPRYLDFNNNHIFYG
ncbi:neuroparsin-A-like [Microplitis mediator]|uniref:neuroparsin-A-like n=1 Tax=Microplitis mediator TaxID=375433 RepID=UPI0025569188|nr:neuroparsin-A-like [Microplitis mediator]